MTTIHRDGNPPHALISCLDAGCSAFSLLQWTHSTIHHIRIASFLLSLYAFLRHNPSPFYFRAFPLPSKSAKHLRQRLFSLLLSSSPHALLSTRNTPLVGRRTRMVSLDSLASAIATSFVYVVIRASTYIRGSTNTCGRAASGVQHSTPSPSSDKNRPSEKLHPLTPPFSTTDFTARTTSCPSSPLVSLLRADKCINEDLWICPG